MRKYFLILSTLLLFLNHDLASQTRYGLVFGYNMTKPDFGKNSNIQSPFSSSNYRNFKAIHIGFSSVSQLKNNLSFGAELMYIAKGIKFDNFRAQLRNTLALPIFLRYKVLPKISIQAGLEFNYIFSRYQISDGIKFDNLNDWNVQFKNFVLGPTLGAQIHLSDRWKLNLRYVRVLDENPSLMYKIYARTFTISAQTFFSKK